MNLGICDAVALGRTLSKYISNGSTQDTHLLEEYNRKRQIVAKNVIKLAATALNMVNYMMAMPALVRRLIAGALDFMSFAKRKTVTREVSVFHTRSLGPGLIHIRSTPRGSYHIVLTNQPRQVRNMLSTVRPWCAEQVLLLPDNCRCIRTCL